MCAYAGAVRSKDLGKTYQDALKVYGSSSPVRLDVLKQLRMSAIQRYSPQFETAPESRIDILRWRSSNASL